MTDDAEVRRLVGRGTELISTVGGGVAGALVGGAPGAALGAAGAAALQEAFLRVVREVSRRRLAPRAEARAGAVFLSALEAVRARILAGESLRNDGFTDGDPSTAEELLEGVLIAAQDSYEERKLFYLAQLYASFVFSPGMSREDANQLIRLARDLSYRQLVILSAYGRLAPPQRSGQLSPGIGEEDAHTDFARTEMLALVQLGLAWIQGESEWPVSSRELDPSSFVPFAWATS